MESDPGHDPPRRPNWLRLGLIVAAGIVVALLAVILVKSLVSAPRPALGETDAPSLHLGSCLAESATDLATYAVVDCATAHPQQVVASIDMSIAAHVYTDFRAMGVYADEVCDRFIEYGLFVKPHIRNTEYDLVALAVPSQQQFDAGQVSALCAITSKNGSQLTEDLYEPMP